MRDAFCPVVCCHRARSRHAAAAWSVLVLVGLMAPPVAIAAAAEDAEAEAEQRGVRISYRLPVPDELPARYRVTLAITDPDDPQRILTTFLNGAVREVTERNRGRFTDAWDGLDDNGMPLPPGRYGVRGIHMPAMRWYATEDDRTIIPRFIASMGDPWAPKLDQTLELPWLRGHSFGPPMALATTRGGRAAFYWQYVENSHNPLLLDLKRPIGHEQVLSRFESWGAAGGWAVATDGEQVWAVTDNGGIQIIYRADRRPFGSDRGRYRQNVTRPEGHVTSIDAWHDQESGDRLLYTAQRGRIVDGNREDRDQPVNQVHILDGDDAELLAAVPLDNPQAIQVTHDGRRLYALHHPNRERWQVSRVELERGVFAGPWQPVATLDAPADPFDFQVDREGRIYISVPRHNQVYRLDREGRVERAFGAGRQQQPGQYDPAIFMAPHSLALWEDADGKQRLLVNERQGPYRISEWSLEGERLREWTFRPSPQAQGHGDFAIDPRNRHHVYNTGPHGLVRAVIDYESGRWRVDAVWPEVRGNHLKPRIIHHGDHMYLAVTRFGASGEHMLFRRDGDRWVRSAGLVREDGRDYLWHDAAGDGQIHRSEHEGREARMPALRYWGEQWLDDLSMTSIPTGGHRIHRLRPTGFDEHGNPIYDGDGDGPRWEVLLEDPIFKGRAAGEPDRYYGPNELTSSFNIDWTTFTGSDEDGFFVNAMGGPALPHRGVRSIGTAGNRASQIKIARCVPDEGGPPRMQWRIGRKHLGNRPDRPGELFGTMHINPPVNGVLGVHDGHGLYHLFTESGFYLDTLMVSAAQPGFRGRWGPLRGGVYAHFEHDAGEFWTQTVHYEHDGRVYLAMGRSRVNIYELENYPLDEPVYHYIEHIDSRIDIAPEQIAPPDEHAQRLRQ